MENLRFQFHYLRKYAGIILPIRYRCLSLYIMKSDTSGQMIEILGQLSILEVRQSLAIYFESKSIDTYQMTGNLSSSKQLKSNGIGLTILETKENR